MSDFTYISTVILVSFVLWITAITVLLAVLKSKRVSHVFTSVTEKIISILNVPATFIAAWIDRGME